ncbi:MAG TPA: hypothetical protein VH877_00340 [Polyangia bacterium]|jgi:hypothetical protein|nr:hypothetical protein [Polyangia bacterium]
MDHIFELLTELSIDPFLNEAFIRDSKDILLQAGLSPEDPAALARATGDGVTLARGAWARCAVLVDPGFDPIDDTDPPSCTA